jgi:hypothetical protein
MVHCIADQVDKRVADLVNNRSVQFGFLAEDLQIHLFAQVTGQAADDAGEFLEDLVHRDHAHLKDLHLQFRGDKIHPFGEFAEFLVEIEPLGGPLLQVLVELDHAVALKHQLPYLVHQVVQAFDIDAHG